MPPHPPKAEKHPVTHSRHGVTWQDDYAWLRDADWQAVMREPARLSPAIRAHLEAENAYADALLEPTEALQQALIAELRGRIKEHDDTVPEPDGPYAYFPRYRQGGEHPVLCRLRAVDGVEEELLDCDRLAAAGGFFALRGALHSPDHGVLAYAIDPNGSERCEVRFRRLDDGTDLPDRLPEANGALAWSNDARHLLYVQLDANHRPWRVLCHRLGDDPAADRVVYEEGDPGFFLSVGRTSSRRWLLIMSYDHESSEVRLLDADRPDSEPRLVAERVHGERYDVVHDAPRARFLILTNREAEDFQIVEAPEDAPQRENWRPFLPHAPGRLRLGLQAFRDHLVVLERAEGLPRVLVLPLDGEPGHEIFFPEAAYSLGLLPGFLYETAELRFVYSSLATPPRTYAYDLSSRTRQLLKEQEVPSGHDPEAYVVERLEVPAADGELVPLSLLRRRDRPEGEIGPVLLYGYGSYGITIPAAFAPNRFSLVDRGFTYAIAHIRGGTDKGWAWYRKGKLKDKPNTFSDFIACARHLIATGRAEAGGIAIHGGSAGGLLVGAVLNQAPELLRAAVAEVPFVDVLNTMCDATLPLTPPEWKEWGNPIEDAEAFRTIRGYSPYDNVAARAYPWILATAGLTDPRVTYWEPAKWVARLRELKSDDNPLLLRTHMDAGHGGAAGRFDKLKEVALVYAFLLQAFGLAPR